MFDMDGTLTDSFSLDENCYVLAIEQALDLPGVRTDWESYEHTTASYCLDQIVRHARGHAPTAAEARAVQARMIALMQEITQRTGRRTQAIPGAAACLHELRRRGIAVAIASGDWEATARHKFASAAIPVGDLPAAFCDVAHPRTDIMQTALTRATAHYGCSHFDRIVYVGDASWDVRACRELNWPLVGIAPANKAERLRSLGVTHIVPHYNETETFLAAIDRATPPSASRA